MCGLSEIRILFNLAFSEFFRFGESLLGSSNLYTRDQELSSLYRGRILISATERERDAIISSLCMLERLSPVVITWLISSITVIKVGGWRSKIGAFHPSGIMIGLSGEEINLNQSDLACTLGRRIILAETVRRKNFIGPRRLMLLYVSILLREVHLAWSLSASKDHLAQVERRLYFWLHALSRCNFSKNNRLLGKINSLKSRVDILSQLNKE
jgi:hypothetical protein